MFTLTMCFQLTDPLTSNDFIEGLGFWPMHCIFLFSPCHTAHQHIHLSCSGSSQMYSRHQWVPVYHSPHHCPQAPHCLVSTSCTEDHRTGQTGNASHDTDSGSNTAYSMGLKKFFFHLFKVWWLKTSSFSRGKGIRKGILLAWAFQSKVLFFQNTSCYCLAESMKIPLLAGSAVK